MRNIGVLARIASTKNKAILEPIDLINDMLGAHPLDTSATSNNGMAGINVHTLKTPVPSKSPSYQPTATTTLHHGIKK
eukprot:5426423-Ditylum_brightwellii.AAC.1